jgi:excisionase family DNA binding protein
MQTLELLTLQQVSDLLQVSNDTISRLVKDQKLAGTKIGNQWRFTTEAIENYIKSRTVKTKKVPS